MSNKRSKIIAVEITVLWLGVFIAYLIAKAYFRSAEAAIGVAQTVILLYGAYYLVDIRECLRGGG